MLQLNEILMVEFIIIIIIEGYAIILKALSFVPKIAGSVKVKFSHPVGSFLRFDDRTNFPINYRCVANRIEL